MSLSGAVSLVLLLGACAHSPARTDSPRPAGEASAASTPRAIPEPAEAAGRAPEAAPPPTVAAQSGLGPRVAEAPVDFARDIQPILASRCQPCHFPGGKMYERLPFDRAATIRELGTRLFTRIKAEDEQALLRRFLAQSE